MIAVRDVSSGRVVLACDSVLWTMKLLDYMSVHPRLGPYITMAGKMIMSMSYIIVMLVVALLSFGLARQSITFPNENWHWILVRNIFLKPYFMLYGEVYADEIDTCGDEAWDQHLENGGPVMMGNATTGLNCVPGYWIPPVLMTFFLLIANILLMSMLIAIFNHIFDQTDEIAQQIWLFQRYRQVMEYESTPFLPPPFTPLYHAYMLIKLVHWRLTKNKDSKDLDEKRDLFDFSLKLFLNDDQVEKLHDFEEDCMEDLARQKELEKNTSSEQRILRTDQRTDQILNRMVDLQTKETMAREAINDIDGRLGALEKNQTEILEYLRTLVAFNAAQQTSLQPTFQQARHSPTPDQNTQHLRLPENQSTIAGALSEERLNAPMSVRRVRTSTICAMSSEEPTLLSPRSAGATAASAAVTDAVRLASVASMDQLPMSVMSKLSTVSTRRNQRHEEYTSITDSIAVCVFDRRLKTRSHSSEQDSVPQSEIDEEKTMSPRKRSMIALPHHPELDEADNSTFEEEISRLARDEEGHADCELTDVDLEDDEEEEEEDQINASELVSDADDDVVEGRPHAQTLASIASKMSLQVVDETGDGHHPSPQIFSPSADASPQLVHRRRSRSP
ncbi:unnamed protein product [Caenorhabditis auriculariae]|uniref:Ion transport domain-containing protein n=1 Tax=Caenorhabditis auriculariae TaxID=2777116 RepID=A0A8S1GN58_9PELO|nr:unnamed protein product [Caenorhabditis auriculariae]